MATFGIIHTFRGGTQEQYENALKVVHPDGGAGLPDGQLLHLAGPSEDGWVVVAVHESKESWEKYPRRHPARRARERRERPAGTAGGSVVRHHQVPDHAPLDLTGGASGVSPSSP